MRKTSLIFSKKKNERNGHLGVDLELKKIAWNEKQHKCGSIIIINNSIN